MRLPCLPSVCLMYASIVQRPVALSGHPETRGGLRFVPAKGFRRTVIRPGSRIPCAACRRQAPGLGAVALAHFDAPSLKLLPAAPCDGPRRYEPAVKTVVSSSKYCHMGRSGSLPRRALAALNSSPASIWGVPGRQETPIFQRVELVGERRYVLVPRFDLQDFYETILSGSHSLMVSCP